MAKVYSVVRPTLAMVIIRHIFRQEDGVHKEAREEVEVGLQLVALE